VSVGRAAGLPLSRRDVLRLGACAAGAAAVPLRLHAAGAVGDVMAALSSYMAAAKDRALPAPIVEHASHHVLDTVAAMISGTELPPGRVALALASAEAGRPVATVAASRVVTSPADAALVNGVLAHSDETDDSHAPSQSHPGASIVPAALALGESYGISGRHFLRAVTLGYDVGTRTTMALGGAAFRNATRRSTHAYAGTFGSAAAAGCAAALDAPRMRWLLDYASQQASGYAVWGRDTDHIEKGFVFGGMPARNGVAAAVLVRAGWTGVDDVFSGDDNFFQVNAPAADPSAMVSGLGERFEVANTDIKKWTVGTPIQAPLDALVNIRARRPFGAEDVEEVTVRLAPSVGAVVDNRDMPDICLQHMMAVMLVDGTASFAAAHDKPRMQDAAVLRQRRKVRYAPDDALTRLLPVRVAVVEVTFTDGTRLTDRVEAVRGTPRNPMSGAEIVDKARALIGPVLGAEQASALIDALLSLDALADVRALRPLLQKRG
jgi:2-methylcitrate dehydratase PrpD